MMEWIRVTNRLILLVAELNSLDDEEEDGEEEDEQWGDTQHKEASPADYTPTFSTFLNIFGDKSTSIFFYHQYLTAPNENNEISGGLRGIVYRCLLQQFSFELSDIDTTKNFSTYCY
jgi:hypothetical protein